MRVWIRDSSRGFSSCPFFFENKVLSSLLLLLLLLLHSETRQWITYKVAQSGFNCQNSLDSRHVLEFDPLLSRWRGPTNDSIMSRRVSISPRSINWKTKWSISLSPPSLVPPFISLNALRRRHLLEATVRVTDLPGDTQEQDLRDLFIPFGQASRVSFWLETRRVIRRKHSLSSRSTTKERYRTCLGFRFWSLNSQSGMDQGRFHIFVVLVNLQISDPRPTFSFSFSFSFLINKKKRQWSPNRTTKVQRRKKVQCVSRNIEFRNDCSSVQLLIQQISILYFSHRNKNTTKWNDIFDQGREWWNRIVCSSVLKDQRSTNDERRFDYCQRSAKNSFICRVIEERPTINLWQRTVQHRWSIESINH